MPEAPERFGGHSGGETPGPIPNPEVKPSSADGTAREAGWESRSPPRLFTKRRHCAALRRSRARPLRGPVRTWELARRPGVRVPPGFRQDAPRGGQPSTPDPPPGPIGPPLRSRPPARTHGPSWRCRTPGPRARRPPRPLRIRERIRRPSRPSWRCPEGRPHPPASRPRRGSRPCRRVGAAVGPGSQAWCPGRGSQTWCPGRPQVRLRAPPRRRAGPPATTRRPGNRPPGPGGSRTRGGEPLHRRRPQ
jgi:hypothetical protein